MSNRPQPIKRQRVIPSGFALSQHTFLCLIRLALATLKLTTYICKFQSYRQRWVAFWSSRRRRQFLKIRLLLIAVNVQGRIKSKLFPYIPWCTVQSEFESTLPFNIVGLRFKIKSATQNLIFRQTELYYDYFSSGLGTHSLLFFSWLHHAQLNSETTLPTILDARESCKISAAYIVTILNNPIIMQIIAKDHQSWNGLYNQTCSCIMKTTELSYSWTLIYIVMQGYFPKNQQQCWSNTSDVVWIEKLFWMQVWIIVKKWTNYKIWVALSI